jgi:hypothetical protein
MRLELNINLTSGVLEKKHPTNGDHCKDDAVTETHVSDRICTFYPDGRRDYSGTPLRTVQESTAFS